jgi:hypothetical protein
MTAKEKASELISKYSMITKWKMGVDQDYVLEQAKKCALIAVDELIDEFCAMDKFIGEAMESIYPLSAYIQYWLEVKQEIKNF